MALCLQSMDELALLLGRDAAKDRAFFGSLGQRRLTLQRGGIDPVLGPVNARVGGHMADSLWVVAREDLDLHALLSKEAERLGDFLENGNNNQALEYNDVIGIL